VLNCPQFLQIWHRGPSIKRERSWLLFRGSSKEIVAYNPYLDSWSKIPLSSLPSQRVKGVASAGGILCLRRRDDSIIVYNPFTKYYRKLAPKVYKWKYPTVGMAANNHNREFSYQIAVAGNRGEPTAHMKTEVYNSSNQSWKQVVGSRLLPNSLQVNAVHHDGLLYTAGFNMIMVFDWKKETWTKVDGPPESQHTNGMLNVPHICECRGRLITVEVVSERYVLRRVTIWAREIAPSGKEGISKWKVLEIMPDDLLMEVVVMSKNRLISYFGHDDLICFVIARREILAYTISRRTWRWLPTCPFIQGYALRFSAFSFQPTLQDP
jgi:hypothetical protein